MSIPAAYLGVILIWSTTPLAIKWSSGEGDYLFGVSARMVVGLLLCLALLRLLRMAWPMDVRARLSYLIGGVSLYGGMTLVYWAAQYVDSGLISVMYGVSPLLTGVFAWLLLAERRLGPGQLAGMLLGVAGLALIFGDAGSLARGGVGVIVVLFLSVAIHAMGAVLVKRYGGGVNPLAMTTGALAVAVPLYLVTWVVAWLQGGAGLPEELSLRSAGAILYLGVFGSVLGFVLYFYMLKHISASAVSLITLITPVLALLLGSWLNGEVPQAVVWNGAGLILAGLGLYSFAPLGWRRARGEEAA